MTLDLVDSSFSSQDAERAISKTGWSAACNSDLAGSLDASELSRQFMNLRLVDSRFSLLFGDFVWLDACLYIIY